MVINCTSSNIINMIIKIVFLLGAFVMLITLLSSYKYYRKKLLDINKFYNKVLFKLFCTILILSVPVILYKVVKPSFLFVCENEKETSNNAEKIRGEIALLKQSLSPSDYEMLKNEINEIIDEEIKKELQKELDDIEKYVTLNKTIESLKTDYKIKEYYSTYKEIEELSDNDMKNKLYTNIISLGKDKPLDVNSGYTLQSTNGISYYLGIPLHPLENMSLIVVMQPYSCHADLAINSSKYTDKEFFYIAPPSVGAYDDGTLKKFKVVIDDVVEKYKINKNKIIITGHSNGALSTLKLASFFPNYFAAAVPVSSTLPNFSGDPYVNTAFWGICGTKEACATTMQTYASRIINKGGTAKSSTYPGGHIDTGCVFLEKEVLEWALEQEKK